jgi:hypothetical protein
MGRYEIAIIDIAMYCHRFAFNRIAEYASQKNATSHRREDTRALANRNTLYYVLMRSVPLRGHFPRVRSLPKRQLEIVYHTQLDSL